MFIYKISFKLRSEFKRIVFILVATRKIVPCFRREKDNWEFFKVFIFDPDNMEIINVS